MAESREDCRLHADASCKPVHCGHAGRPAQRNAALCVFADAYPCAAARDPNLNTPSHSARGDAAGNAVHARCAAIVDTSRRPIECPPTYPGIADLPCSSIVAVARHHECSPRSAPRDSPPLERAEESYAYTVSRAPTLASHCPVTILLTPNTASSACRRHAGNDSVGAHPHAAPSAGRLYPRRR